MSSRYKNSPILEYTTTDFSTGESTTYEYRGSRKTLKEKYPTVSVIRHRNEDWDMMAYSSYGVEETWFLIAEYNKVMFPWASKSGDLIAIPPKFVAADYLMN